MVPTTSRRDALLSAAMDCVAEKGFEGLRLREVASRAGIDHSTLHHHFASKQDLVDEVLGHVVGQVAPTMPDEGEPADRLHQHLSALVELIGTRPRLFAVFSELDQRAHHDPSTRATLRGHEAGWRGALREVFERGDWSPAIEPDAAVELVIAVIKGVRRHPDAAGPAIGQLERLLAPSREPSGEPSRKAVSE